MVVVHLYEVSKDIYHIIMYVLVVTKLDTVAIPLQQRPRLPTP